MLFGSGSEDLEFGFSVAIFGFEAVASRSGAESCDSLITIAVGALFVLVVLLHYSTVISALTDRSAVLAQQVAMLEERLRRLEDKEDGDV